MALTIFFSRHFLIRNSGYLIKEMQSNEANKEKILADLNKYLTEDRDRKLFNL